LEATVEGTPPGGPRSPLLANLLLDELDKELERRGRPGAVPQWVGRLLDAFLAACKARGTQRTDSTHVLAAIRILHRLECVLEAMHYALNQLSAAEPAWVQQHVPPDWYSRYGLRSDQARLPKDTSKREALARQVGADGYQLLAWVQTADTSLGLRDLPALEALRQIWLQQYYRCTVLPLYRLGARSAPLAHERRATALSGTHRLSL
jgi:hypothetical protein